MIDFDVQLRRFNTLQIGERLTEKVTSGIIAEHPELGEFVDGILDSADLPGSLGELQGVYEIQVDQGLITRGVRGSLVYTARRIEATSEIEIVSPTTVAEFLHLMFAYYQKEPERIGTEIMLLPAAMKLAEMAIGSTLFSQPDARFTMLFMKIHEAGGAEQALFSEIPGYPTNDEISSLYRGRNFETFDEL